MWRALIISLARHTLIISKNVESNGNDVKMGLLKFDLNKPANGIKVITDTF